MGKGLPRSMSRGGGENTVLKKTYPFSKDVDITGTADAVDFATAPVGDLPEGNLLILGVAAYIAAESADVYDDWAGDVAVGSVPTADNDLADSGEADFIASTAITAGSGTKNVVRTRVVNATPFMLDNTAGDKELNVNLLVDDNFIDDQDVATFTLVGDIHLAYVVMGDD